MHNLSENANVLGKLMVLCSSLALFSGLDIGGGQFLVEVGVVMFVFFVIFCFGLYQALIKGVTVTSDGRKEMDALKGCLARFLLPQVPETFGLRMLVPGSAALARLDAANDKAGLSQDVALQKRINTLQGGVKELGTLLSLRFKQTCMLWTLAEHWTTNNAGNAECQAMKDGEQQILQALAEGVDVTQLEALLAQHEQKLDKLKSALSL